MKKALAVLFAVAALARPSSSQLPPGRMTAPNGYAKDFALVKRAGLFHVFYIESGGGTDFNYLGHQTSPDLYQWTVRPNVLIGDRAGWNADFVWAPSIIERDGTWWMFYTGVRARPSGSCPGAPIQQIGVATSTDLENWTLAPDSWLDPTEVPWALQPKDSCLFTTFGGFRDPNVIWDPETGQWVMLYVTIPSPDSTTGNVPHPGPYDPSRFVVGLGRAPDPFATDADWTSLGALWITHAAYPSGTGMATWESPHAFSHVFQGATMWFLFASTGRTSVVEGVSFLTGPSLTLSRFERKNRTGWTWRGPIGGLQWVDSYGSSVVTSGWFATEYMKDPETGLEYFANVNIPWLEFRQIKWRASFGFDLDPPFAIRELDPRPSAVEAGQAIDLIVRSVNARDGAGPKSRALEAWMVDGAGDSLGVLPVGLVGLPDSVTVIDDETHVMWFPRLLDTSPLRMRVRLKAPDSNVQSPVVTIYAAAGRRFDSPGGSHDAAGAPAPAPRGWRLTALGSPGPRPAFELHLPDRSVARLTLFDVRGRRVRRLLDRELPAGSYRVAWDATDDAGGRLPAGIYLARFETGRGARTARIALIDP